MPINCTLTYRHLANDTEDTSGDIGTIPAIGPVYAEAQFADGAAALGSDATGYTIRRFEGYLDTDGILKNKPGGTAGMRVWANDPLFNLTRLPYTVTFDLYDALGRRIALNGATFDAPSTDTTVPLANVLPVPGAMAGGIQRRSSYAEDIIDIGVTGHALVIAETPAEAYAALGGGGSPGAGITDVVQDTTPQLGGDLDLNGFAVGLATAADLLKLHAMTATGTELNYVDGVTSAIQAQIDGKQPLDADLTALAALTTPATKLAGIATGATANDTDANLKARANHTGTQSADTLTDGTTNKAFLATERTKLTGIATAATANSADVVLLARANHTGTQSADTLTDGTTNKAFLATERTKLTGVATAATANSSDATLLARANHTGTQTADTITDGTTNKAYTAAEKTKLGLITGTNTGDQTSVTGNAGTATALATARTINGVSFNGTANITIPVPSDFMLVQVGNIARAVGSGDFAVGHYVGRAFTVTKVVYQFDTVDASGSTTVELRRNGTQVTSSSVAVTAANQVDGTATDAARSVTVNQSFSVGDRISLQITGVGTTPGKGLRAWVVGTWN
jgi:hypothetical protein